MEPLLEWDRWLFYTVNHGLNHPWLDPIMWAITSLGLGWVQVLLLLCWTLFPILQRKAVNWRARWRMLFLPGFVAFAGSGLTVQILKRTVSRLRPSNLPDAIVAPDERIFHNSFPSGHTATAFALACWLWLMLHKTRYRWVGWVGWGLACCIGLSRIYRGVHYPSDVLAGALIGILWGLIAYSWLNRGCSKNGGQSGSGKRGAVL